MGKAFSSASAIAVSACVCAFVMVSSSLSFAQANDPPPPPTLPLPLAPPPPQPFDTETDLSQPRLDAQEAAKRFRAPQGFRVQVFAAEPDVANPIAATWDTRGRLWVAENFTYAERPKKFEHALRDRILIFDDQNQDGKPESRRVFWDQAQHLTSLEVGLGGVWIMCPPQLLFIPDRDGDDRPDGPPIAILEGFTVPPENYHNFANGLKWGPDGWLYGRCGASAAGTIRRADEPSAFGVPMRGGIWRYHPTRKQFEALTHGTTNPWGHDWDRHGEAFFINTVNGHLWHLIPGAHLRRPHTIDANPLVYQPIETHADHWHWDNSRGEWTDSRKSDGEHDRRGGGHAHVGMMIYQGEQWPESYRGRLMTLNQHGHRMNVDRLERKGNGYVGTHEPDILYAGDTWFRGVEVTYGPDGGVYLIDWSDTGECHENTGVHRNSGRIYKVVYGGAAPAAIETVSDGDSASVAVKAHEWRSRAARRRLADQQAKGERLDGEIAALKTSLKTEPGEVGRLRALWSLHILGAADEAMLRGLLDDPNEHVRVWAIRLLTDRWPLDTALGRSRAESVDVPLDLLDRFEQMAVSDASGLTRLALASALQRIPVRLRPRLAAALLSRAEDADDHDSPALIWHGLIPLADQAPRALVPLAIQAKVPKVRQWIARRCAEVVVRQPGCLDVLLAQARGLPESSRIDIVMGMVVGLAGHRKVEAPVSWAAFASTFAKTDAPAKVQADLRTLNVVFGDGRALDEVRSLALDAKADLDQRRSALRTLIDAQAPDLRQVCETLLKVRFLNTTAMQGLARFEDPTIGRKLAQGYKTFHPSERAAVIETLASRPSFAAELLSQMASGTIARSDLSAALARQIRGFGDAKLTERLNQVWGELRDSPQEKQAMIQRWKTELAASRRQASSSGRAVFQKTCASCHRLFGEGAEVGPDLTGADRKNLDYLLSNIVDPSAEVSKDYLMSSFVLKDGRVINGIAIAETDSTVTAQTAKDQQVLLRADIESRAVSKSSLMPDGLLQTLTADDIADLAAYLMSDRRIDAPQP